LTYAPNGRVETITDPTGRRQALYGYAGDLLTSFTDAAGAVTGLGYHPDGNLATVTDPRGGVTRLGYDAQDRVTSVTWADSTPGRPAVTTFDYAWHPTVRVIDQRGHATSYTFDTNARVTSVLTPAGVSESYRYDPNSNVVEYTTTQGGIGTRTYDGYNLRTAALPTGATDVYDYLDGDTRHRPSRHTNPQGVAVAYDWDAQQRLRSITEPGQPSTRLDYQQAGNACPGALQSVTDPRGAVTSYRYDALCRLATIDRPAPRGDTTMTYDA
jgi:YD repeat-containing protein